MIGFHNIARMYSTTTGTGTLTLTTAFPGCNTFANAGAVDGERLRYTIRDGRNTEVGIGIYTASGTTLSRATVLSSTNGGSKIDCSGSETVEIVMASEDITPFASYYYNSTESITNATNGHTMLIDTEWDDQAGLATLASNQVTLTYKGWYMFYVAIDVSAGAAFNGRIQIDPQLGFSVVSRGYTTAMGIQADQIAAGPFLLHVADDATTYLEILLSNNSGQTLTAFVSDLTIQKIGGSL